MTQNTKEAIKAGLEMGGLFGLVTSAQTLFMLNGMGHIPLNVLINAVFPATAAVGGFVSGFAMEKEFNTKRKKKEIDLNVDDMLNLLDKAGATTEEKIAILIEQKQLLSENKEEKVDNAKTR